MPLNSEEQASLRKFGAAVRRLRTLKCMTQEELADLTDLHTRSLQKIEAGDKNILITTVRRIQKSLDCSWDDLMS
ncbi:helix-turn-helix transcriptional regulator [Brevifollis gellanilyticus]|uniref:helix-turn-helix domain-containing protein n=1 Tax=Brevifollis gellanilyticus TaxID=748831 RepID=UPI0031B8A5C9